MSFLPNQATGLSGAGYAHGTAGAGTVASVPNTTQPFTGVIHDEIDRINSAVGEIEGVLHGGVVAQFPPQPATNKPDRAPCVRGSVEAAVDRLRTIRVRLEAVVEANRSL